MLTDTPPSRLTPTRGRCLFSEESAHLIRIGATVLFKREEILQLPLLRPDRLFCDRSGPRWINTNRTLATDTVNRHDPFGGQYLLIEHKLPAVRVISNAHHHKGDAVAGVERCNLAYRRRTVP
ncbi:hypothetical protein D3C85_1625790 [compost metagenome]